MTASELTEHLRAARPIAPDRLREHVRAIATAQPAPTTRRRLQLPRFRILVPVAAATAVAAAGIVALVRPQAQHQPVRLDSARTLGPVTTTPSTGSGEVHGGTATVPSFTPQAQSAPAEKAAPLPTPGRAQRYAAQLTITVKNGEALSAATARAQTAVQELGGYVVNVSFASADSGSASLTLRVPTAKVQTALARLTALGRVVSQQVQIDDLQATLDQLDRRITILRSRIAHITALLADPSLSSVQRAQLETQRVALQNELRSTRRSRSGTATEARYATIQLELQTARTAVAPPPSRAGRTLHRAAQILAWEGAAAVYAVVVVGPFAILGAALTFAARARRRSEESRLLARG